VLDLSTGKRIELPLEMSGIGALVANGLRVGAIPTAETRQLVFLDLDVPRDPAALARWLDEITNARSIEGSDAIAWP
jgi:hypothetical protein